MTNLTHLDLEACGDSASDLVVAALACRLQRLQILNLQYCYMASPAVLAPIGTLSELRHLELQESSLVVNDLDLMQLSTLTQLNCSLGTGACLRKLCRASWQPCLSCVITMLLLLRMAVMLKLDGCWGHVL